MRKLTILFALLTLSAGMWAQEVGDKFFDVVSELNFEITAVGETNTVAVSPTSSYFQPTTCTVPVSVTYKSVTFTVTSIGEIAFSTWSTLQTITLPSSVTTIGEYAFQSCGALQSIDLSHVTTIGEYAFQSCGALQSIDLSHVTTIGDRAFTGCKLLQSVDLSHVTTIGYRAFTGCKLLQSISLPSSVTSIGDEAFATCGSLTEVTVAWTEADKILAIEEKVFYQIANKQGPSGATLRVPEGTKALYQAKDVWNTFGKIIDLAEIKATAIAEIETAAASAKADIDNASTYEEAKETQNYNKALIDAIVSTATNVINNATTVAGVEKERDEYMSTINEKREEALAEIAKINALVEARADAIAEITTARPGIQNTNINNRIDAAVTDIQKSTTVEEVDRIKNEILEVISIFKDGRAEGIEEGQAEALGEMAEPCTDCPAVEVKKGSTTIKLYNPEKVEFKKVAE